jgi:hypothetical protein
MVSRVLLLGLLVEYLDFDPFVLRHDQAVRRNAIAGFGQKDDSQEIDMDDLRHLAPHADALTDEFVPAHGAT